MVFKIMNKSEQNANHSESESDEPAPHNIEQPIDTVSLFMK
jgi:hypothetical protein